MATRRRRRRREADNASPDLTPMIDVTFQLLIFFILCTRFKVDERNHRADLPLDEGLESKKSIPKEFVTIYCNWDADAKANEYIVAIGARNRKLVPGSRAGLTDMVIFPSDNIGVVADKKALYRQVYDSLIGFTEAYIVQTGAKIEKLELSYSKDATKGTASGTAPWMFVSLAIDACAQINKNRVAMGKPELSVTFKFADAQGKYARK